MTLKLYYTTGAPSRAGTAYPAGAYEFTPGFLWSLCCVAVLSFLCT
jgi:hypothetical protein